MIFLALTRGRAAIHRSSPLRLAAVGVMLLSALGCRTTEEDIARWAVTQNGPKRLAAVVQHGKYPLALRTEAALTLIGLHPRHGRRVGLEGDAAGEVPNLVALLAAMPEEPRTAVVHRLVPALVTQLTAAAAPLGAAHDQTFPFKDAAFALLTADGGKLVARLEDRQRLLDGLRTWAQADFANRVDNPSQIHGFDQLMGLLGASGTRQLPDSMRPGAPKLERLANFIALHGDEPTRLRASEKLVEIASAVQSEGFLREKTPLLEQANSASKLAPTKKQFEEQLTTFQDEELIRVFQLMKKVGRTASIRYLLDFAAERSNSEKRRVAALSALEGHLDATAPGHLELVAALASSGDSPDGVRDLALARLREFPRPLIVEHLYALFPSPNWKLRWVAAESVLRVSDTTHLEEFLGRLGKVENMALTEPIRYGELIAAMKGPESVETTVAGHLGASNPVPARLAALGWYFHKGAESDRRLLEAHQHDQSPVPPCAPGTPDCEWTCDLVVDGKPVSRQITRVGEFVRYCVLAEMDRRLAKSPGPR
jgi:hypothetical protein